MNTDNPDPRISAPSKTRSRPSGLSRRGFLQAAGVATAALATTSISRPGQAQAVGPMPTNAAEICRTDAVSLAAHIRAKRLSPVEVIDAVLDRMDKLEPTLHAFCTPTPELARNTAQRVEEALMAGWEIGPLAGVPIGIKDMVFTKGIRTTSGSIAYENFVPDRDDVVVERLKQAGAIILGKTNVPEFGYSGAGHNMIFPTTTNPWNPERTAGGSSAGSAAAVAAGMGPFAIGSDGGGSVRIPAALCGLYGFKGSMGRVPLWPGTKDQRYPGASSWESIEHIGPISRTVADAALMMSVIAGPDPRDRHTLPEPDIAWMDMVDGGIAGLKVAYSPDWGYAPVDPEVRAVVDKAVEVFERDLGCTVEIAHPGFENPMGAFWGLVALETDLAGMRDLVAKYGDRMQPHLVEFLNTEFSAEDLTGAVMGRKAVANTMAAFMQDYDLLLTPTVSVPAFGLGIQGPETIGGKEVGPFDWLPFTFPINMTGQPAASVPAGFTSEELPVGLHIVGGHLDDATVLRASAAFEEAVPWKGRWPPMLDQIDL